MTYDELNIIKEKMLQVMNDSSYSDEVIKKHSIGIGYFISYISKLNIVFNRNAIDKFEMHLISLEKSDYFINQTLSVAKKFLRFYEDGYISMKEKKKFKFIGIYGVFINEYIDKLYDDFLSPATIRDKEGILSKFNDYLNKINSPSIDYEVITNYIIITSKQTSQIRLYDHVTTIKQFLTFLYNKKILLVDLAKQIKSPKYIRNQNLPSTFTSDEINSILKKIDTTSSIGKRKYAMILLVVKLGLRASDVTNLQFTEIDWENMKIKIIQKKTKKFLEHPLLPEIGNAIIDYLRYGRRKCDSSFVFISHDGAVRPTTPSALYNAINYYIRLAGINVENKQHGPHAFRHSLATHLMKNGESLTTISGILGHSDTQVTTVYLSVDEQALKKCSLAMPPLNSPIYKEDL